MKITCFSMLALISTQLAYASPFDIAGVDDIESTIEQNNIHLDVNRDAIKNLDVLSETLEDTKTPQLMSAFPKAEIKVLDIKTGVNTVFTVNVDEVKNIHNMSLKLEKCLKETQTFRNGISIGYVKIDGKNIILSSDPSLSKKVNNKYLMICKCID